MPSHSFAADWLEQTRLTVVALVNEFQMSIVLGRIKLLRSGVAEVSDLNALDRLHHVMLKQIERTRERASAYRQQVKTSSSLAGADNRKVCLSVSNPAWSDEANREAEALRTNLGSEIEVYHIGSTAVENLAAKPILDFAIALPVDRFEQMFRETKRILLGLGYRYVGVRGGLFFEKGPKPIRTHALQVHPISGGVLAILLHFRDLLQIDTKLRQEYAIVKMALAAHLPRRRWIYAIYKGHWIQEQLWHRFGASGWGEWYVTHRRAQAELVGLSRFTK